jgi:transposase
MLQARSVWEIPQETERLARELYKKGNEYVRLRDELGPLYRDSEFADLFVWRGRPAESPGFLAMVTVMQFAEGLTDRQAVEAVRSRIDWKYALGLELTYSGFAHSVLHDFRERLIEGGAEMVLLDGLLQQVQTRGLVKARGRQRTDSTHILAAVRQLNRLECIGETLRNALNDLATVAPDWLVAQVTAEWFKLYGSRFENYRLPKGKEDRETMQLHMGQDGVHLLQAIYSQHAPDWLWQLPSVQILRQVWVQQFYCEGEQVHIRTRDQYGLPPGHHLIQSPYDPEARNRTKRKTNWTGYSVHLTESCDEDQPHLITHVVTTPATTADVSVTEEIHQALAAKSLLPSEHLVDGGYTDADLLVQSALDGIDLVGPVRVDVSWQANAQEGFGIAAFIIEWEKSQVVCPQGKVSHTWRQQTSGCIDVQFALADCAHCASRPQCTHRKTGPRLLKLQPQPQHLALQSARQRQESPAFKERYRIRAGVEGTISQSIRAFEMRRSRYIGQAKTHFQHVATVVAVNITRLARWLDNTPRAQTRQSRFAALAPGST